VTIIIISQTVSNEEQYDGAVRLPAKPRYQCWTLCCPDQTSCATALNNDSTISTTNSINTCSSIRSHHQPTSSSSLGTNLIHDFTAMTPSVKSAVFCEKKRALLQSSIISVIFCPFLNIFWTFTNTSLFSIKMLSFVASLTSTNGN